MNKIAADNSFDSKRPILSIVVPIADDDGISAMLDSIDLAPVEVIAVLNSPTQRARNALAGREVVVVEIPERNLGAACDAGCKRATSDAILLMNSDCILAPGTLRALLDARRPKRVARGVLKFTGETRVSRLVEQLQDEFSLDPVRAFQPGLLIPKDIDTIVGYYFDTDIHWSEDFELHVRLESAGIGVDLVRSAVIKHSPPKILTKLRSSFRYGIGRRIAEKKNLLKVGQNPWSHRSILDLLRRLHAKGGFLLCAYGVAWIAANNLGRIWEDIADPYNLKTKAKD